MFYKKILQHDYSAKLLFMLVLSCFSSYFAGSHFLKNYYDGKKRYMEGKWCLSWVMLNLVIRDLSGTSLYVIWEK